MPPSYAINETPEQALCSNWAILPARAIAALGRSQKASMHDFEADSDDLLHVVACRREDEIQLCESCGRPTDIPAVSAVTAEERSPVTSDVASLFLVPAVAVTSRLAAHLKQLMPQAFERPPIMSREGRISRFHQLVVYAMVAAGDGCFDVMEKCLECRRSPATLDPMRLSRVADDTSALAVLRESPGRLLSRRDLAKSCEQAGFAIQFSEIPWESEVFAPTDDPSSPMSWGDL